MRTAQEEIELIQLLEHEKMLKDASNDIFYPLFANQDRYLVLWGGGSSGKSIFAGHKILDRTVTELGHRFLVCRKVAKTLRESCFAQMVGQIGEHYNYKDFQINQTDMRILHKPTGNLIIFAGLDDVEKLKSIYKITGIWIEEASELEPKDLKQLDIRLRGLSPHYKQIILSFNPVMVTHHLKGRFFGSNVKGVHTCHSTYKDNRFLDDESKQVLEEYAETDMYYYTVYCLGQWGVLGDLIFKNWELQDLRSMQNQFINRKHGLDFGYSKDPAAMPCTHYERNQKTIYVYDELYMTNLTNDLLAIEVAAKIQDDLVIGDSAEPKSIKELSQAGIVITGARKGKGSVNHGIQWLQQQKIIVDIRCINFKNEIEAYQWKTDRNGNVLRIPIEYGNHLMDGLRYAYEEEYRSGVGAVTVNV